MPPRRLGSRGRALRPDARPAAASCSGSSRSTSRSAAGGRPTTSSTCSSRSSITRRSRVEAARESAESARHQRALEELLAVSSRITGETVERRDPAPGLHRHPRRPRLRATSARRSSTRRPASSCRRRPPAGSSRSCGSASCVTVAQVEPLLDDEFLREGCYLLTHDEARARLAREVEVYPSQLNGRGPWAWNRHWLLVPLEDGDGALLGIIWVDNPSDRLVPSADRLQALRIFANDAAAALVSGRHLGELRFLADHDPLTRLLNRRAFVSRLDGEVARARRYNRTFGLVIADLDDFKQLNDRYGHAAGRRGARRLRERARASRCGSRTTRSASAATSSRSCSPRRPRTTRGRSSRASRRCSSSSPPAGSRGRPISARASAARRAPRTRPTRRRCSASPTRRCTTRSGTARSSASSRAVAVARGRPYVRTWFRTPDRRAVRLPSGRAEGRPERARQRRARHLRAGRERALGRARLLDRRRLARRARRPRRRLALHRAPPVQGLAPLRRAGDRGDVRRDGRRAERRDLAREHRRLRARPRPPRRDGARGDDRHGLRALLRRGRPGARGRARGDRDVRGHAAGARARPLLARRSSATTRSAGP